MEDQNQNPQQNTNPQKINRSLRSKPKWVKISLLVVLIISLLNLANGLQGTANWSNAVVGILIILCVISIPVVGLTVLLKKYPSLKSWSSNPAGNYKNDRIMGLILAIVLIPLVFAVGYYLNCYLPLGTQELNTSPFKCRTK